jgi:hypothetical protein
VKNKVLGLLLIACVVPSNANDAQIMLSVCAGADLSIKGEKDGRLVSEKEMRRRLYWQDVYNPHYYLLKDFPFDYYIAILSDHITYLENQISLQKSGLKSNAMLDGALSATASACMGYVTYAFYVIDSQDKVPGYMIPVVTMGGFATFCALVAAQRFHKASCYAERLVQRLDRDKRILATLKKAKTGLIVKKVDDVVDNVVSWVSDKIDRKS